MKAKSYSKYKNGIAVRLANKRVSVMVEADGTYSIHIRKTTKEPEPFLHYEHSRGVGDGLIRLGRESFDAILAAMIDLEQPNQTIKIEPL